MTDGIAESKLAKEENRMNGVKVGAPRNRSVKQR